MIDRLDHLVLTVADPRRTVDFYVRGLGMREETFGGGRRALVFGHQKFNLTRRPALPSRPRAACPAPGTADFCLIAARPLAEVEAHLRREGFTVELGPVPRTGAAGPIRSLYLRDPDGNLVEVSEDGVTPGGVQGRVRRAARGPAHPGTRALRRRPARTFRCRAGHPLPGRSSLMTAAAAARSVEIVEVAPRDGFQPIGPWIPTEAKVAFVRRIAEAGVRRVETGAFVSATAVPQMRDAGQVLAAAAAVPGLRPQVLVPSARRANDALAAGARHLVFGAFDLRGPQPEQRPPLRAGVGGGLRRAAARPPVRGGAAAEHRNGLRLPLRGRVRRRRSSACWSGWWRCAPTWRCACATPPAARTRTTSPGSLMPAAWCSRRWELGPSTPTTPTGSASPTCSPLGARVCGCSTRPPVVSAAALRARCDRQRGHRGRRVDVPPHRRRHRNRPRRAARGGARRRGASGRQPGRWRPRCPRRAARRGSCAIGGDRAASAA